MDIVSTKKRSQMMSVVRQRATPIEIAVRRLVCGLGLHYRVNNRSLPGSPDISNQYRRWALFVNGCFWHGHKNCRKTAARNSPHLPEANRSFWADKIQSNRRRDARNCRILRSYGFLVIIVWECQLKCRDRLEQRLKRLLIRRYPSSSAGGLLEASGR
jgi:DNA mismatch endonuclease, patch repair protein